MLAPAGDEAVEEERVSAFALQPNNSLTGFLTGSVCEQSSGHPGR